MALVAAGLLLKLLLSTWQMILIAYLAVNLGRAVVVHGASALFRFSRERIPWSWSGVLVRGALPMVLALSLPGNFPQRELLVTMTFGVVLLSIMIHGVTMSPLLRWFGIVHGQERRAAVELARGKLMVANAALRAVDEPASGRFWNRTLIPACEKSMRRASNRWKRK